MNKKMRRGGVTTERPGMIIDEVFDSIIGSIHFMDDPEVGSVRSAMEGTPVGSVCLAIHLAVKKMDHIEVMAVTEGRVMEMTPSDYLL